MTRKIAVDGAGSGWHFKSVLAYAAFLLFLLFWLGVLPWPIPRLDVDQSDGKAYYRDMLDVIESGDTDRWCDMVTADFKGYFRSSEQPVNNPVHFNSAKYCRSGGVPTALVVDPDHVKLKSIKLGAGGRYATVEYVAIKRFDEKTVETTFVDEIESLLGFIRVRKRWVFEEGVPYKST